VGFDLIRTIRTGRAHARLGIITRKQSGRFQRYVYANRVGVLPGANPVGPDLARDILALNLHQRAPPRSIRSTSEMGSPKTSNTASAQRYSLKCSTRHS